MLRPFFPTAMRAPARHLTFRRTVALHVALLTCLGWTAAKATTPATLSVVGQLALVLGILEGGALVGWRLTQLPKSQALEFLLVSPMQPRRVFFAEMLVGIARFALVCLAGLPVMLAMVLGGAMVPLDLWTLGLMPFAWGVVAGLGLTVWAYEPARVRRIGEQIGLCGVLIYLVVGILAGENLRLWLMRLPQWLAEWCYKAVMTMHHGNPFGVVRNWFTCEEGPAAMWPLFVQVNILGGLLATLFALRAAYRLKGHFHDRHYKPLESNRIDQSEFIRDRPLSWWAVRRVMEYSGRVNVWLAGGFCFLYAAFIIAGDRWPPWMGRLVFQIFDSWGGAPVVATAMCVLAAVPAAFQYGLWDSTISNRCKRLELLLLSDLIEPGLLASVARGRVATRIRLPHLRGTVVGRARGLGPRCLARRPRRGARWALAMGILVRHRLPRVLDRPQCQRAGFRPRALHAAAALLPPRANLTSVAAFIPTAACYLPLKSGVTESWVAGFVLTLAITIRLTDRGLSRCDCELRNWYDSNEGRKTE